MSRGTVPKPVDRDDWLAVRRPYFNASAVSCLWDRHPYQTAADYAVEKLTGRGQAETSAMRRGTFMEDAIARWWTAENGIELWEPGELFIAGPVMATIDRVMLSGPRRPVEIKTASGYVEEPLPYWLDQCQAIMFCYDAETIELVWVDSSMTMQSQTVDADADMWADIEVRAERFMAAIELGIVPDWITPDLTAKHVTALHPDPDGEVELDEDTAGLVARFVALRTDRSELDREMDAIKNIVARQLGEHSVGVHDGVKVVSYSATKGATSIDTDRLKADHPDLVEQYLQTRPGARRFVPAL